MAWKPTDFAAAQALGKRVYWRTFGVLCLIIAVAVVTYIWILDEPAPPHMILAVAAIYIVLAAPLIQLVGALVAAIILSRSSDPSRSSAAARSVARLVVGRMTLGMLIGAIAGIAVMLLLLKHW